MVDGVRLSGATGLASWSAQARDVHGDFDVEPDSGFAGWITRRATPAFHVTRCASSAVRIARTESQLEPGIAGAMEVKLVRRGSCTVTARGRSRTFPAGSILVYRLDQPVLLEHSHGFEAVYLTSRRADGTEWPLRSHAWTSPCATLAVALRTMDALADHSHELSVRQLESSCRYVIGLLADVANDEPTLAQLVRQEVATHFADPDLSTSKIAGRLGWSPRRVQLEMQRAGTTVTNLIRSERLERARAVLDDTCARPAPIAQVAKDHGFSSSSAFIAAFRERYGLTPGQARRQAVRR